MVNLWLGVFNTKYLMKCNYIWLGYKYHYIFYIPIKNLFYFLFVEHI